MSDCFFNTRKIRNARLILNRTNQSIFCTSSAPMSVSSALFCTAAIPNVTDIAMHILCASRRTCSTTYSLVLPAYNYNVATVHFNEKENFFFGRLFGVFCYCCHNISQTICINPPFIGDSRITWCKSLFR